MLFLSYKPVCPKISGPKLFSYECAFLLVVTYFTRTYMHATIYELWHLLIWSQYPCAIALKAINCERNFRFSQILGSNLYYKPQSQMLMMLFVLSATLPSFIDVHHVNIYGQIDEFCLFSFTVRTTGQITKMSEFLGHTVRFLNCDKLWIVSVGMYACTWMNSRTSCLESKSSSSLEIEIQRGPFR